MKKIIISDFDHTFYKHSDKNVDEILQKNIEAVQKLQKLGFLFAFCTGRNVDFMKKFLQLHQIPFDYLICCNGSVVLDNLYEEIHKQPFNHSDTEKIFAYLKENNFKSKTIHGQHNIFFIDPEKDSIEKFSKLLGINPSASEAFDSEDLGQMDDILQMGIAFHHISEVSDAKKYIEDNFSDLKTYCLIDCILILHKDNSKSSGINYVLEKEGIEKENVYAIGDDINDLSMIREYNGFAVSNAIDEIKAHQKMGIVDNFYNILELL